MTIGQLFSDRITCQTRETANKSDHLTISTEFLIDSPGNVVLSKILYKNADWKALNKYVKDALSILSNINLDPHLNLYTSKLTKIVLERIEVSVPLAKASLYNKRW